jgi:hypothetical protein
MPGELKEKARKRNEKLRNLLRPVLWSFIFLKHISPLPVCQSLLPLLTFLNLFDKISIIPYIDDTFSAKISGVDATRLRMDHEARTEARPCPIISAGWPPRTAAL